MTEDEVRQVFEDMWPQEDIDGLCQPCGVIERQRKLNLGMLVPAMVISAGTPGGAYQADVRRSYLACEVPHVARSACSLGCDEPVEPGMAALANRALADARAQQVDLSGPLGGVTDWYIVDATTVTVRDAWRQEFPGTGDYAAIKVHKVLSVGCGAPVRSHFSRPGMTAHIYRSTSPGKGMGCSPTWPTPVWRAWGPATPTTCASSSASRTTGGPRSTTSPVGR